MPKYPTMSELKALYAGREETMQALSAAGVIRVHDVAKLDRQGRFIVACDHWSYCDEVARGALLSDEHPHVRSAAKLANETYKLEAALALGFGSVAEMDEHQKWLAQSKPPAEKLKAMMEQGDRTGVYDTRILLDEPQKTP